MKRCLLFELGDQPWVPNTIRRGITEYLAAVSKWTGLYKSCASPLNYLVAKSSSQTIVILGAGSGGGILDIAEDIVGCSEIILTDIFPHQDLALPDSKFQYWKEPVDARRVPRSLDGVRVMFATFHHFRPSEGREILKDAILNQQPIAIIEGTERSILSLLSMILIVPLAILVTVPFIRPFSFSRLFWTFVIPALPILGAWDGFVSCLRTYNESDFRKLVADLPGEWKFQKLNGPVSMFTGSPEK